MPIVQSGEDLRPDRKLTLRDVQPTAVALDCGSNGQLVVARQAYLGMMVTITRRYELIAGVPLSVTLTTKCAVWGLVTSGASIECRL